MICYNFLITIRNLLLILSYLLETSKNLAPPLFDIKIVYSYVIEVADSESVLGLHGKALVSEILAFYHLENALG